MSAASADPSGGALARDESTAAGGAVDAPAGGTIPSKGGLRERLAPLAALLRRDLRGGRRGAATAVARGLAILVAAGGAVTAYVGFRPGDAEQVATATASWLFLSLMALSLVVAAALAASALRAEREAGTLDLLLLAGIRPGTLVAGRTLSSFALLLNLLLASLPALALLVFFRAPSLEGLAAAALVLVGHFLAVAAVAVAISAWSGSAGMALALSFLLFGSWTGMLVVGVGQEQALPSWVLLESLGVGLLLGRADDAPAWIEVAWTLVAHLLLTVAAMTIATAGVHRVRGRGAVRDPVRERLDAWAARRRGRRPVDARWPLTWLARRTSAPVRISVQAVVLLPVVAVGVMGGVEVAALLGGALILFAYFAALGLGATAIASERERRTWDSLLTTRLTGRAILSDLARRAVVGSFLPLVSGLALLAFAHVGFHGGSEGSFAFLASGAVVAGWLVAIAAASCGSLAARSTGGALAIALGFLVAEPAIGLACGALIHSSPLGDEGGTFAWMLLLADAAFLSAWLLLRARWRRVGLVALAVLPTLAVLAVPVLATSDPAAYRLAPSVVGSGAGLALAIHGLRALRGVVALSGVLLVLSCGVLPVVVATMGPSGDFKWLFPWATWPGLAIESSFNGLTPVGDVGIAFGHSLLVLGALGLIVLPRLERWLGRAG